MPGNVKPTNPQTALPVTCEVWLQGYATGIPKNRTRGSVMYLGTLPQWGAMGVMGVQLLLSR